MFRILITLAAALILTAPLLADDYNGARCEIRIEQWDADSKQYVRLHVDTTDVLQDVHVTGFAAGMSLDLEVTAVDSLRVTMNAHAHTFAEQPDRKARNFKIEYGLPAHIDDLTGKNKSKLRLTLTPLEPVVIDRDRCPFIHYTVDDFAVDPTAHMNIYYVPQTLGDFHWNAIKGLLEEEYETFNGLANFNMPGKYLLYLCPCKLNSIIWDDRFGMMVDPVRSTMFSIYSQEYNSTYPFLISQAATYHNYGYAPAFVSEGLANYLSFAVFDMKHLRTEGNLPKLSSLLDTYTYMQTAPRQADRISGTFVRFLIDQYGIGAFLNWYRASDDLNQKSTLESNYGKTVDALEAEWLEYVDTVSIRFDQAGHFAYQAEAMFEYGASLEYGREMLRLSNSRLDSLLALSQLSRTAFFAGEFYDAAEYQASYLGLNDSLAGDWLKLASYQMMVGDYDQAAATLKRGSDLDPANNIIIFNRGLLALHTGDTAQAKVLFNEVLKSDSPEARLESQLTLAELLRFSGNEQDRQSAEAFCREAVAALSSQDQRHNPSAAQAMWLGIAYLGIDDTGNADDFLRTALYLETRPFYKGLTYLWLGKVADIRGERTLAKDYYSNVLSGASAKYHQEEARRWLQTAYRR